MVDDAKEAAFTADHALVVDDENNEHGIDTVSRSVDSSIDSTHQQVYSTHHFNQSNLKRKREEEDETEEDSSDDDEIPDPSPQPSTQIRRPKRFNKKTPSGSKSASRQITPTRSRSGELTIKFKVPASGKSLQLAKETTTQGNEQVGEKRKRSEDRGVGSHWASSLSDTPLRDDECMTGAEL